MGNVAVVSNAEIPFRGPYTNVRVVEDRKIPLYKASMMMQMGKRFSDVESTTVAMGIFDLRLGYLDGVSYEVYTAQKWGY